MGSEEPKFRPSEFSVMAAKGAIIKEHWTLAVRRAKSRRGVESEYEPSPKWDGGMFKESNYQDSWAKAARFSVAEGISFLDFIVFIAKNYPEPQPNLLYSHKALKRFRHQQPADTASTALKLQVALDHEREIVDDAVYFYSHDQNFQPRKKPLSRRKLQRRILISGQWDLSPLFRYCLAVSEGFADLAAEQYFLALVQYLESMDGYDRIWRSLIPESLRDNARRLCSP